MLTESMADTGQQRKQSRVAKRERSTGTDGPMATPTLLRSFAILKAIVRELSRKTFLKKL